MTEREGYEFVNRFLAITFFCSLLFQAEILYEICQHFDVSESKCQSDPTKNEKGGWTIRGVLNLSPERYVGWSYPSLSIIP